MKVIHSIGKLKKKGEGEGSFLLSDRRGGYLFLPNNSTNSSNYQGWTVFNKANWSLYKTVENIYLDGKEVTTFTNKYSFVERESGKAKERFFLHGDCLIYEIFDHKGFVNIDFDFRNVDNIDDKGRNYTFYELDGGILIVKYQKYAAEGKPDHEYYLAIKNVKEYEVPDRWMHRDYSYDKKRNAKSDYYIYGTLKIKTDGKLIIAHADSDVEAVEKVNRAWHYAPAIMNMLEKDALDELNSKNAALNAAINSLNHLTVSMDHYYRDVGVFAGYPWFFQFWARDELISSRALMIQGNRFLVKDILMCYLGMVDETGRLSNRNVDSDLKSADSTGWLFLRLHDFLQALRENKAIYDYFTKEELESIKVTVDLAIKAIHNMHMQSGLVVNDRLETWMDTSEGSDYREGARIEIQALQLRMYQFADFIHSLLGKKTMKFKGMEKELKSKVVELFFKDEKLADGFMNGSADMTQRPNIFLAHYIYPELLTKAEWKKAFDNALKELWLDWGGLASIGKEHYLFSEEYSGMNNRSYHRGDSWYFVNNIAAVCMKRLDSKKYKSKIDKIKEASEHEILFSGILGHAAEISSAKELRSEGAQCQTWSAATFIELIKD